MHFSVVTLFPEMFSALTEFGVLGKAIDNQLISIDYWNPREYTKDRHRTVDDRPYGGGPGMLMKVQPLRDAIQAAKKAAVGSARVIYLSPQGAKLNHSKALELAKVENLVFIAGRYEGIDERLIEADVDEELSIGDFVLSGGELAAMVVIDAVSRLVPGVLGHVDSAQEDSFVDGLLDCPHYTRPEDIDGKKVPAVLLSGNHDAIKKWREKQALGRTWQRRPDLLAAKVLSPEQKNLLDEFIKDVDR